MADQKISSEWVVGPVYQTLVCTVCQMILHDPVQTRCEHIFCRDCMVDCVQRNRRPTCPIDRTPIPQREWQRPALYLRQLLQEMKVRCPEPKCSKVVQLDAFQGHRRACRSEKIVCEKGCGIELARKDLPAHNCIQQLRDTIASLRQQLAQQRVTEELQSRQQLTEEIKKSREKIESEISKMKERMNEVSRQMRSRGDVVGAFMRQEVEEPTEIQPTSSGTFFIKEELVFNDRIESPIQDIGGVEWQLFLTDPDDRPRLYLKCYGPINRTGNRWKIVSNINVARKGDQEVRSEAILRNQYVSAEHPLIGIPGLYLRWHCRQSGEQFRTIEFYILFSNSTATRAIDRLSERSFYYDFNNVSAIKNYRDVMISDDFYFGNLTWNILLCAYPNHYNVRLACNRNMDEEWGECIVRYKLAMKGKGENIPDHETRWLKKEFSQWSKVTPISCQIVTNLSDYVVNDTISIVVRIKLESYIPPRAAVGM